MPCAQSRLCGIVTAQRDGQMWYERATNALVLIERTREIGFCIPASYTSIHHVAPSIRFKAPAISHVRTTRQDSHLESTHPRHARTRESTSNNHDAATHPPQILAPTNLPAFNTSTSYYSPPSLFNIHIVLRTHPVPSRIANTTPHISPTPQNAYSLARPECRVGSRRAWCNVWCREGIHCVYVGFVRVPSLSTFPFIHIRLRRADASQPPSLALYNLVHIALSLIRCREWNPYIDVCMDFLLAILHILLGLLEILRPYGGGEGVAWGLEWCVMGSVGGEGGRGIVRK
jgi:hypothetical protein